jgi:hypothetical protein
VITLTPRGALIDGSKGRPVNVEADVAALAGFTRPTYPDIPVADYVATAAVVAPGGGKAPLNIAVGIVPEGARPTRSAAVTFATQAGVSSLPTLTLTVWE